MQLTRRARGSHKTRREVADGSTAAAVEPETQDPSEHRDRRDPNATWARHAPRPSRSSKELEIQPALRRQLGTERHAGAAPVIHAIPSKGAISAARFALFLTVAAWAAYFGEQIQRYVERPFSFQGTFEAVVYVVLVTLLTASASAYLLCRIGFLVRARNYHRVPRAVIDAAYDEKTPSLTIIVPSYREEARIIRQTLLSAALQEYPDLRVVLLIDDPPDPIDPEHLRRLEEARLQPAEIAALLATPRQRFETALETFERSVAAQESLPPDALQKAADTYDSAVIWLQGLAVDMDVVDHIDAFLVNDVLLSLASDFESVASALRDAQAAGAEVSVARLRQLYRRLTWVFGVEMTSFERKLYASLSHEPNKAANLNSYLGLMGGRYREAETPGGRVLLPVRGDDFTLDIPDPDYVLTLDADSTLLPEYCLRLVAFMERPENADVGVVQTPYSAYRGAPTRLERLAGASTDLQHMVHQGLTYYGATFWVGANAVLRKAALDTIAAEESYNGFAVRRYIQERTVIEDTESSIDLRLYGWRLENIPERLSYSATPPDFGALCVQRERWANGGLVILPKLVKLARARHMRKRGRALEIFLRLNYLSSIGWSTLGLAVLLFYPFDQRLLSILAVLTALPYFAAISADLRRAGYRRSDVVRLYGFNLMLLAVNAVGTMKSIGQAIGGQKVPFARTPKIRERTITPLAFVVIPFAIAAWSGLTLLYDVLDYRDLHAIFAASNLVFTLFAMLSLHGIWNSLADTAINLREWVYRPVKAKPQPVEVPHWVTVLYYGATVTGESRESAAVAGALAAIDGETAGGREILLASDHGQLGLVRLNDEPARQPDGDGSLEIVSAGAVQSRRAAGGR